MPSTFTLLTCKLGGLLAQHLPHPLSPHDFRRPSAGGWLGPFLNFLQPDAVFDWLSKDLDYEFRVGTGFVLNGFVIAKFGYSKRNGLEQGFGVYLNDMADSFGVGVRNTAAAHAGIIALSSPCVRHDTIGVMQPQRRSAAQAGIERLYHYEPFNAGYLTAILRDRQVHFSDPSALNDPWDCRPWFDDAALDDPESVENLIKWFFSFTPASPVSEGEARATQNEIRRNPEYRRGILKRFSEGFLKMIPNRWKIYCLTPVPDSTLMWSHYGHNHSGICLEFTTRSPVIGAALEVEYLADYPKWAPHLVSNTDGPHVLLTKSDDWRYEREYRIIGLGDGVARPIEAHPMFLKGNFMTVPDDAISAVIVGCEANYDEIAAAVKGVAPDMPIKRAVRSPSKYRLQIVS